MSPYETHISKITFICIKNCHHRVNHHCWNVQIWFYISALGPLCCVWVLPQHLSIRYFGLRSEIATNVELLIWKQSDFWNNFWLCLIMRQIPLPTKCTKREMAKCIFEFVQARRSDQCLTKWKDISNFTCKNFVYNNMN